MNHNIDVLAGLGFKLGLATICFKNYEHYFMGRFWIRRHTENLSWLLCLEYI